jgi:hypothetical protein
MRMVDALATSPTNAAAIRVLSRHVTIAIGYIAAGRVRCVRLADNLASLTPRSDEVYTTTNGFHVNRLNNSLRGAARVDTTQVCTLASISCALL